jgi:hypothetical protein
MRKTRARQAVWEERVRNWKSSGKSVNDFVVGQPYAAATLRWWSSRLARDATKMAPAAVQSAPRIELARVEIAPARAAAIAVEVGGARVVVERGFDEALLRSVVRALGERR